METGCKHSEHDVIVEEDGSRVCGACMELLSCTHAERVETLESTTVCRRCAREISGVRHIYEAMHGPGIGDGALPDHDDSRADTAPVSAYRPRAQLRDFLNNLDGCRVPNISAIVTRTLRRACRAAGLYGYRIQPQFVRDTLHTYGWHRYIGYLPYFMRHLRARLRSAAPDYDATAADACIVLTPAERAYIWQVYNECEPFLYRALEDVTGRAGNMRSMRFSSFVRYALIESGLSSDATIEAFPEPRQENTRRKYHRIWERLCDYRTQTLSTFTPHSDA